MSLDISKLEKVRELAGGIVQARCPACAEGGHDRTGEHLRIYPDGRFGCCVHPKDKEHRKRIFALAGVRGKLPLQSSGTFTVRLKTPSAVPPTRSVKAALVFPLQPSPGVRPAEVRPPSFPVPTGEGPGTLGTPKTESEKSLRTATRPRVADFGTLGTGNSELRARARVDSTAHIDIGEDFQEELKDSETAVPSVPRVLAAEPLSAAAPCGGPPLPYLTPGGSLVIPFDSPERYHWWKPDGERLTVAEIRAEVSGRKSAITKEENHAVTV